MNKLKSYIAILFTCITLCWGLIACKSTKTVTPTDTPTANTTTVFAADKYLSMVTSNNTTQTNLTAKVKVVVDVDGK